MVAAISKVLFFGALALAAPPLHHSAEAQSELADAATIFLRGLAEYYAIPENDVYSVRDRGLGPDELSVVYYLSREANIPPQNVIDRRLAGDSWLAIARTLGLAPDIFYVDVPTPVEGPPYGNAYGYWKNHPRNEWNTINLSDDEIIDLVNLRYVSDRYDYDPVEVINLRSSGKSFVKINSDLDVEKRGKGKKQAKVEVKGTDKSDGHHQDHGGGGHKEAKDKSKHHPEVHGGGRHQESGHGNGKQKKGKSNKNKGNGRGKQKGK